MYQIHNTDCLELLKTLPDNSLDAVVTDPPYGLNTNLPDHVALIKAWLNNEAYTPKGKGFMGESWDSCVPPTALWRECLRVLKPGAHVLAFAGSRTQDLMGLSLRLAGFEIRDTLMWVYGEGFPKSLNVAKAIDKLKGVEPTKIGTRRITGSGALSTKEKGGTYASNTDSRGRSAEVSVTRPTSPEAQEWDGWGSVLKPAYEPILLVRKPIDGTIAKNVLKHRTGALNIDACRVPGHAAWNRPGSNSAFFRKPTIGPAQGSTLGRFPANLILDSYAGELLDAQSGNSKGVSRFFYCTKTRKSERNYGLDPQSPNNHPTVKPVELMRYLVRLVCAPGGTVLDPFAGSGSTGIAATLEGMSFIGAELSEEYADIASRRIKAWSDRAQDVDDEP